MNSGKHKKKILIFYSKTGGGHLRAAEAIAEYLTDSEQNPNIILSNGLTKTNFGIKSNPTKSFAVLSGKMLPFFNISYLLTNNRLGVKLLRFFIKNLWGKSLQSIISQENPDVIISTHHFISPSTIGKFSAPFITIITDLGIPHRIWFDNKSNLIIAPTNEIKECALKNIGITCKIVSCGYPLKKTFIQKNSNKKLNNAILVLGGGSGTGKLRQQVRYLLKNFPNHKIIAICGFNENLKQNLLKLNSVKLEIYGFIDNIDSYMKTSDIIIGKAGPGAVAEAASLNKPFIITDWVGLQERGNVNFVIKNHLGIYCPKIDKLKDAVKLIYFTYSNYSNTNKLLSPNPQAITKAIYSYL